jgi:GT2 family glycosyltransferase
MLKAAIVYPVFNGLEYTKNGLQSLFTHHKIDQNKVNYQVVIVDDGSTDGTHEWISRNYPQVKLLNGTGNLWWSGGINLAVRYAIDSMNCDFILWWNNDIIAGDGYFDRLSEILNRYEFKTIIGSKICLAQESGKVWSMGGLFDSKTGKKSMIGSHMPDGPQFGEMTECDWLPGMGTLTHKSVYNVVGMLDDVHFPQYHGDSDFTFRAKEHGFRILVHPGLVIYNDTRHSGLKHDESFRRLWQSLFSIKSNFNIKKDILFYRKHTVSCKAYSVLFRKYFTYIGGFFKWRIFHLFGYDRKVTK